MKKGLLLALVSSAILCCSVLQPAAYAESVSVVSTAEPYFLDNVTTNSKLSIQGSTANCYSTVKASDAVKITATQTLQKQGFFWSWGDLKELSWTKTVSTNTLSMTNSASGLSSGNYRLKTEFVLTTAAGESKTVTIYSNEQTV